MKPSEITATDQFCGAGGSSQGFKQAVQEMGLGNGARVRLAMNHWPLAIETHNTNFPDTDHACTDISACDPRRYPSTNILITSPECTVHSPAGGGQAKKRMHGTQLHTSGKLMSEIAEERSRATMWDVCRFAEYHTYEIIIVENVIEARTKWVLFDSWLQAMTTLGYDHEIKYINSMHAHPTPQSRDRMYCVFWKKGNKRPNLNFEPVGHCPQCEKNVEARQSWKPKPKGSTSPAEHGKYRTQYVFKCPDCQSIVEPYFFAAFNCIDWSDPGTKIGDRKKPLSPKTEERCQYGIDKYWDQPSFVNVKFSSGVDFRVKPVAGEPLPTQPGDAAVGVVNPLVISSRYIEGIGNRVKSSTDPLPVQVTDGRESILNSPFFVRVKYDGVDRRVKSAQGAFPSQTSQEEQGIVQAPVIIGTAFGSNPPGKQEKSSLEPMSTQDTGQTKAVMFPFLVKNFGGHLEARHASTDTKNASSVFTANDNHGIVMPLIDEHNASGDAKPATQDPLATVLAGGNHHGILQPLLDASYGQSKPQPVSQASGSFRTKQAHGIITDQSFNSFISYYYGGSKVASHITEAMRTVSTKERGLLVNEPYQKPRLEDCYYRMLLPHEIQLGMAFGSDYIVLGNSRQKVKQLGNAVTPPVMKFLVQRCIETLL